MPGGGNWLHYSIWRVPMSQKPNPFLRGYWNLKIVRTLSISYEDGSPHVWRNIHASQEHLSDEELVSSSCIVTNDFAVVCNGPEGVSAERSEEHTSELQSLMRISYAVFCLQKKKVLINKNKHRPQIAHI